MPDWLKSIWGSESGLTAGELALRLGLSLGGGFAVALIYRLMRRDDGSAHLPTTLVFLAILIAAVTQVIGDNIARAFSLVGALSIVRFRTIVRDTRDTAFVIFAVVVGMAIGAGHLLVTLETLVAMSLAAWLLSVFGRAFGEQTPEFDLLVRVGPGHDLEAIAGNILRTRVTSREAVGAAKAKQSAALDITYRVRLAGGGEARDLVGALTGIEGIQHVELHRVDS